MPKPRRTARTNLPPISRSAAAQWLAGFFDGEGCVYFRDVVLANGRRHKSRVATLTNTDPALIAHMVRCLDVLGIAYSVQNRPPATERHKPKQVIEIRKGEDLWRFRDLVPIVAPEKRRKLDEALASYRGLHCVGCHCLLDAFTPGCVNCRKRLYFREWGGKRKAARA